MCIFYLDQFYKFFTQKNLNFTARPGRNLDYTFLAHKYIIQASHFYLKKTLKKVITKTRSHWSICHFKNKHTFNIRVCSSER